MKELVMHLWRTQTRADSDITLRVQTTMGNHWHRADRDDRFQFDGTTYPLKIF